MAAQRIAARPPSALSGSVGINAISPRRRGRRSRFSAQAPICSFASPLTRGRLCGHPPAAALAGLIPAHAGSTPGRGSRGLGSGAHPRSRGVDLAATGPPEARARLIPAHAGSTRVSSPGYMPGRAHPRSRGVDSGVVAGVVGSSPLTRGRRTQQPDLVVHAGLIPAHAGSTMTWISPARPPRAHPRSRGVDLWADDGGTTRAGSSPLTRGRRAVGLHDGAGPGLIPAHAGSTRLSRPTTCLRTAHPRSRGVDRRRTGPGYWR